MTQQYWIGGFLIDPSRNQISQNNQSQTLAPKALSVLTYLAERQGQVISQDELLDNIWQGAVVSPNTLQRSIAQLRKALGDDGKGQAFIKTHAKKGYSLECDVRWQAELSQPKTHQAPSQEQAPSDASSSLQLNANSWFTKWRLIVSAGLILIGGFGAYQYVSDSKSTWFQIKQLRALTATENREAGGHYSPDGEFIVFNRYIDSACLNHIWAKNISTQQEYQLTQTPSVYGSHSFSKDGKQLVFVESSACEVPVEQKICYQLKQLDFNQALLAPLTPQTLLECKRSAIKSAKWLNSGAIVLMQQKAQRWDLIRYLPEQNRSETLYQAPRGSVVSFDYAPKANQIAMITDHGDEQRYIEIINASGEVLSSQPLRLPATMAKYQTIWPSFAPVAEQLVFSSGRQFFTLGYDGTIESLNLALDEPIGTPVFHPDGDRMLVIKGQYNGDIVTLATSNAPNHSTLDDYTILDPTIKDEANGLFQPGGDLVAFISSRSGQSQVWLNDGQVSRQLSQFPLDTYVSEIRWAADGQSLIANAEQELYIIDLSGISQKLNLDFAVETLFDWNSEQQLAWAMVRRQGAVQLAELNLAQSTTRFINRTRPVVWAQRLSDNRIVYTDPRGDFWLAMGLEDKQLTALNGQGSRRRFVIAGEQLFGINDNHQLWRYSFADNSVAIIGKVLVMVEYITDVRSGVVMMSMTMKSRKEVVEVILQNR